MKKVAFGGIVVIEFIDMSGVMKKNFLMLRNRSETKSTNKRQL